MLSSWASVWKHKKPFILKMPRHIYCHSDHDQIFNVILPQIKYWMVTPSKLFCKRHNLALFSFVLTEYFEMILSDSFAVLEDKAYKFD